MTGPFRFACAGATIQDQQTLVTSGNTHGGVIQTVTFVADTTAGVPQLRNMASNGSFQPGTLYEVSGPGISDGTFFIYNVSILEGLVEGSVNLSQPANETLGSATFLATSSIVLGDIVASISNGSDTVVFGGSIDLLPGIYGILGPSIGVTNTPIGSTSGTSTTTTGGGPAVTVVPSAFFQYDGSSGSAQMRIFVAVPHTTTGFDSLGMPTEATTYSFAEQQVLAEQSATAAYQITGFPDSDWYSITSIPATVLASLTPGLRYNISGNGIQTGTTFIAPAPGSTSIELDQATSSSDQGAILTITGPRTPDAPFDPVLHDRFDEQIVSFEIAQEEGSFATLTAELKNPNVGLLAAGRNLWCWLSYDQNWTPEGGAPESLVPLFNGRLIGVPKLQAGETISLQFLARPDDFNAQKLALYEQMAVLPFYDPVWLATNVTTDTVLETYSALWAIDRTTLQVTTSDVLQGEDGTITIGEDVAFYDNFSLEYGDPPLVGVSVSGSVAWNQQAEGLVDITGNIIGAFSSAGSPYKEAFAVMQSPYQTTGLVPLLPHAFNAGSGGGGLITTLLGDGLKSDWPRPGTNIGGGWSLTTLNDPSGVPYNYIFDATRSSAGGWMTPQYFTVNWFGQPMVEAGLAAGPPGVEGAGNQVQAVMAQYQQYHLDLPISTFKIRMTLQYRANRRRTETVSAVVTADVQRELSDSSQQDMDSISFSSEYVSQGIDPGGAVPIGTLAARSYFQSDRGTASFEYLMLAARAKLRARSRAVDVTFATNFQTAIGISLRHSVTYLDRRLPGGSATGKVKSYRITVSDQGMLGEFTIGCAIGNGDAATAATGTNTYVEDSYVDPGYQVVAGGQAFLVNDELAYESLDDFVIDDDGLDLTNLNSGNVVNLVRVTNGFLTQLSTLQSYQNAVGYAAPSDPNGFNAGDPVNAARTLTCSVTLDVKPVAGAEFHTDFFPAVSLLSLPKAIDLAAQTEVESSMWDAPAPSTWDGGASVWDQPSA